MASLTVIVPTYKRPDDLAACLAALRPQIVGHAERSLIVVNDGTHDAAYQSVLDSHGSWFTYLAKERNGGPAAARNYAARHAEGDFIVFTDDDCRPPRGWLDYLQARLDTDPWLDGLAGYTTPVYGNPKSIREWVIASSNVLPGAIHDELGRLICAVTAALAVRRAAFEQVGGFDETFRPSGEDLDLVQRIIRTGAIIEADANWRTGHTTTDTIRAYIKRFYVYGEGSARYALTRADWTHPDLRHYLDPEPRKQAVAGWTRGVRGSRAWRTASPWRKLALWAFVAIVSRQYARGFADGAARFVRAEAPPPTLPWMLWPRLGYADAGGLPRR